MIGLGLTLSSQTAGRLSAPLPTTGLVSMYTADSLSGSTWSDLIGANHMAISGSVSAGDTVNGYGSVRFPGTSGNYARDTSFAGIASGQVTIALVTKTTAPAARAGLAAYTDFAFDGSFFLITSAGKLETADVFSVPNGTTGATNVTGAFKCLIATFAGASAADKGYLGATEECSATHAGVAIGNNAQFMVGTDLLHNTYTAQDVAAALVYSNVTQVAAIAAWAAATFGV